MMIRTGKYLFTLLLVLAQLTATTGYTAMIHYCRMAAPAPGAGAIACSCSQHTAPEVEPASSCCHAETAEAGTDELPQPGLDRTPCCEFVSHFHHVDETAPLAPSMPTLVPAFLMILPPPDRHIHHGSVPAFSSAPPDFQHTLPLLI